MNVTFNSVNISSGNYSIKNIQHETATPRDLFMYELSREGGANLINAEWKPKNIIITGIITGETMSALETNIDTFKKVLSTRNANLDISYETGTRRYIATAKVIQIERDYYNLTYAPFSVEFVIPTGAGLDIVSTSFSTVSISAHTLENVPITIGGTKEPRFNIEIDFDLASSVSSVSVFLNGDKITIDETISAGQTLIIDTENKVVTIDGVAKNYTGIFPRLTLGENYYKIVTSSTSHRFDVTVTYTKNYL